MAVNLAPTLAIQHIAMHRREFLIDGCRACAALLAAPAIASLSACSGTRALSYDPPEGSSTITVPTTAFGSGNSVVISSKAAPDRIWLTRLADGTHRALALKCTHKGGPLNEVGGNMVCGWHDSTFNLEGKPTGGPAKAPLKSYPVKVEGGNLLIELV